MSYWYNTSTGQVETDDTRSQALDVLGPYETEADARNAIKTARERTERWDQEDHDWDSRGAAPGSTED